MARELFAESPDRESPRGRRFASLISRIRHELGVDVKVTTVFCSPTVAELAGRIAKSGKSNRLQLRQMNV